ncbi:MAG: aldehyde dehydrogenase [Lachnospiraceae bacterium]|nr:aldehyde dehydrogenase [Lachnospiraceae bacterium]
MTENEISLILERQRAYFASGATLPVKNRLEALKRLRAAILTHEKEIHAALKKDLGKSSMESYMCETGLVLSELSHMIRHLPGYAKEKRVRTPLAQYISRSFCKPSPYGTVLIMSPWNYPFLLTVEPLVDALAAGNTAVVKPSAYSPAVTKIVERLLLECFSSEYVAVVTGGREENQCLLRQKFDYIFFTGSQSVGKEVLRHAAEYLTPVTLELGGKSPCIVDETADLKLAARRIVFGKFLNCGQTCVAPDYILCAESVKEELIQQLELQIRKQFGSAPLTNKRYGNIINQKHFDRICGLIEKEKLVYGGASDATALKIEPTLLSDVTWEDEVMQQEIFGPVLPILTFRRIPDVIREVESRPHPLALYLFSSHQPTIDAVLSRCRFGGGCVNDTIIHLATSAMGFGGFGESGMGAYHGKTGFDTFSHSKSIVDKKTFLDLPMRYQPYRKVNEALVRLFLK